MLFIYKYSHALKKWGYTGFGLSVIPQHRNPVRFFFCVTVFSGIIVARILKLSIHTDNELLYCGIENRTHCSYEDIRMSDCIVGLKLRVMSLILLFYPFFFLSLYFMLTLKICDRVCSRSVKARILKLGIHMGNELLVGGLKINSLFLFYPFLSIFLSFKAKFVSVVLRNCSS